MLNVKLGNGVAVHAADTRTEGARCNRNFLAGRRLRVRTTSDPVTCAKCKRITGV